MNIVRSPVNIYKIIKFNETEEKKTNCKLAARR
jgi:hypothetical protein